MVHSKQKAGIGSLVLAFIGCSLLVACSGGGSSGSGASVTGINLTGSYSLNNVECYSSDLSTMTSSYPVTGMTSTVVVSGNSSTTTYTSGSCVVTIQGNIAAVSSLTMNLTNRVVTSATGGSCTVNVSVGGVSDSQTFSANQTIADRTNVTYVYNTNTNKFGLLNTLSDGVGAYCFYVYQKQ